MTQPCLTVIAGPNGSGKSTIYRIAKPTGYLVNADEIESRLSPDLPKAVRETRAARDAIKAIDLHLSLGHDFVVETTLSGPGPISLMQEALAAGYRVELVYVFLDSVQRSIDRVKFRVREGGHDIPMDVLIRRYPRSLANFPTAVLYADEVAVLDNSAKQPRWVFKIEDGRVTYRDVQTDLDRELWSSIVDIVG